LCGFVVIGLSIIVSGLLTKSDCKTLDIMKLF